RSAGGRARRGRGSRRSHRALPGRRLPRDRQRPARRSRSRPALRRATTVGTALAPAPALGGPPAAPRTRRPAPSGPPSPPGGAGPRGAGRGAPAARPPGRTRRAGATPATSPGPAPDAPRPAGIPLRPAVVAPPAMQARLLGPVEVSVGGQRVEHWHGRKGTLL